LFDIVTLAVERANFQVMAAYRRVYDSRHLQANCQEPGSAPEPYARQSSMGYLTLPVGHRITYKLCLTTWKTLHNSQPLYLSELISHYLPHRSLRSSNTNRLTRPAGITSNFSSPAFSVSAPSTWHSLPAHVHSFDTLSTFKRHLKFNLIQSAFTV